MFLLGWAVRSGSTAVDDWFFSYSRTPVRWLQYLVDPPLLAIVVVIFVAVAVSQRRWGLAATVVLAPAIGVVLANLLKQLFRRPIEGVFAYPSGHATFAVTVLGMAVVVAGVARWAVLIAIAWGLLSMVGVGATFHYFTDTVGGLLLGTSVVCVAALVLGRVAHRT
jgi:membrane-associated phospholipid phosphatase